MINLFFMLYVLFYRSCVIKDNVITYVARMNIYDSGIDIR